MSAIPGTIWQKAQSQFGAPPSWVQVGNFAQGVQGGTGAPGQAGPPGPPGAKGIPGDTSILNNYIDGIILVNDAGVTDAIDFGAGRCSDSTNSVWILNTLNIAKKTTAAWAAGNSNGGLFTGSAIPSSTVLHCFIIMTPGGTIDYGFDTSTAAVNRPAAFTYWRRVGSIMTDSTPHVRLFHQYGDEFWWDTSVSDVAAANPGTAAVTRTLTIPTGFKMKAIIDLTVYDSAGTSCEAYVSNLDSADLAPLFTSDIQSTASSTAAIEGYGFQMLWTNTSAQIRSRQTSSTATSTVRIRTRGWVDQRGKNGQ